jgi:hypothetical protein
VRLDSPYISGSDGHSFTDGGPLSANASDHADAISDSDS